MARSMSSAPVAAAVLALGALCGLVAMQRAATATSLESDVSARVENGVPVFDWSDTHNVNMFSKACADGNDMACKELAGNAEALNNLNQQARANARWGGDMFWAKKDDTFQHWGDNVVPLDDEYEYGELQGQVWVEFPCVELCCSAKVLGARADGSSRATRCNRALATGPWKHAGARGGCGL